MTIRKAGLFIILTAVSLAFAGPPPAPAYDYTYARVVRLSLVEGEVQISRPDGQGWEPAVVNLPLQQGYSIATGRGRAEVEFESGATARLAENSVLQFTELALSSGGRITKLTLTQGTAIFYAHLSRDDSFSVATPQLQAVIPEKASFRLDVSDDGTSVSTQKGEVEVDSRAGTNRLAKGNTLTLRASDPDQVTLARNAKADDFERWTSDRDEVIRTGNTAALRYVSSPYSYGLSDLNSYGNWHFVGGYGQCWRPYGMSLGWSPYWNGRWVLYPGFGWTWVSFEPWGWMPYHFGRWVFSPTLGWLWVPGYFHQWQPALVTWVRIGHRVGWVPLAPQDQPGGRPTNLQHGVVVGNPNGFIGAQPDAPNGFIGARRNAITGFIGAPAHDNTIVAADNQVELLQGPPAGIVRVPNAPSPSVTGGSTPPAAITGGRGDARGIVFDPKDRKFVNNPKGPVRSEDKLGEAQAEPQPAPALRGLPGTAPPTAVVPMSPTAPRSPAAPGPAPKAPVRSEDRLGDARVDREATPAPRGVPRGMPRALRERDARSQPAPAPLRVEPQRPSTPPPPPPRLEHPATRVEPPRPAPGMERTPRSSSPPPERPRVERPRPQ